MYDILIAVLVICVVGLILGLALVSASKKFAVEVDERVVQVRECLRGSNCGACGYAGCDALAEAIVKGDVPVYACPGNTTENIGRIAAIIGTDAVSQEPHEAYVRCAGTCDTTSPRATYVGIPDCRAAALNGLSPMSCAYGCLGLGSCVRACPQNAIAIVKGVAMVDPHKCIGCGLCVKTCPKGLIVMRERALHTMVHCANPQKGSIVKKLCSSGCIGCGLCVKQCTFDAVHMDGNLPVVDSAKCTSCGKCVEKCPTHAIALGGRR